MTVFFVSPCYCKNFWCSREAESIAFQDDIVFAVKKQIKSSTKFLYNMLWHQPQLQAVGS